MEQQKQTAYERLCHQKDNVIQRWVKVCKEKLPTVEKIPKRELIDSLPLFLDHLCDALNPKKELKDANEGSVVSPVHGHQRAQFVTYNLKMVLQEYEILLDVIRALLNETGGYTLEEYEVISNSLWKAARESAVAYSTSSEIQKGSSERIFQLLVQEVIDHAIFVIDAEGLITTWNEGAKRIKQYEAHEVVGKHFGMLYGEDDQKLKRPDINLDRALREGRHTDEWWRRRKDGTLFWAMVSITPLYENNVHVGFAKVVHDLTAKKNTEQRLEKARIAAEQANIMKTAFLTNMSHEIRTPLSAILGFTEIIKNPDVAAEERNRYVDIIERNGKTLVSLIDDLLDISKVEAGKLTVEYILFDIREMLADIVGLFEGKARQKGLLLDSQVAPEVPHRLYSDPIRVRQILSNVIGNAVKFTDQGSILVHVDMIDRGSDSLFRVIVKDTGPGITDEQKKNLFEPFVQADPSTTRRFGGTGLGLALSRKLARQLGGDLIIGDDCAPQMGCSFHITVSHDASAPKTLEEKKSAKITQKNQSIAHFVPKPIAIENTGELNGVKILLVEDTEDNQFLVKTFLKKTGVQIDIAHNGAEGVQKALNKPYDLVLMDIQMPVLDGNDAAMKLREAGFEKPLVALTAHAMKEDVERSFKAGFNAHVSKPIDSKVLIQTIRQSLR